MTASHLTDDLRRALDRDELDIVLQPVLTLATGDIHSVEALARWVHPRLGPIEPDVFIPVAEASGDITRLGPRVLRQALTAARRWAGPDAPPVTVNASPIELASPTYARHVLSQLMAAGVAPAQLMVETTEAAFRDPSGEALRNVRRLRAYGIRVALDDFWSGVVAVTLRELPIDLVKLDGGVVADLLAADGDDRRIRTAIRLAASLGLDLVAEAAETPQQCVRLLELGCRLGQGYALMPPSGVGEVVQRIREDRDLRVMLG